MKLVIIEPLGVEKERLLSMAEETLKGRAEIIYYDTRTTDTQELIRRGQDADVIVVSNLPLNGEVIRGCKNLKLLSVAFTGVDHIDMEACKKQGVTVCNCAGYSTCAVADLVFGLLIGLYRNLISCDSVCRREGTKDGLVGFELEGKTFGVIGTGAIGLRVAEIAKAFGCRVLAYSRTVKELPGITYVDMDRLLEESDIISLHVPLNDKTRGMIGAKELGKMKKTAVLINTARGPIVDSKALAEALKEGRLAGAGVDVFEQEPPVPSNHPLFSAPNTIVTPHAAFATKEAMVKRAVTVFENVDFYLKGTPRNVM